MKYLLIGIDPNKSLIGSYSDPISSTEQFQNIFGIHTVDDRGVGGVDNVRTFLKNLLCAVRGGR